MANHLELQGSTWHVRLSIPADARKAFGGRKILSKSLETGLRSEAMNRRLPYLAQWKAEIAAARAQAKAPKEDWRPSFASMVQKFNTVVDMKLVDLVGASTNVSADVERFKDEVNEYRSHSLQILEARHSLTPAEIAEAQALAKDPHAYKPKSPITKPRLAAFRAAREEKKVSAKNVDQQESKLTKLSTFLAESGKKLDFDCVVAWLDSLTVAPKTKAQYINAGTTFWKWAMKYDTQWRKDFKDAPNPFENHELPQARGKEKADAQRVDFSLSELAKLHSTAVAERHNALADLILLGTYTGGRIEELCQLRIEHVIEVDGVLSFDITDSKTVAGIRVVPVHPALTKVVERLVAESSDGYLVPSNSRNKYGIRSDLHSKAFGRLKASLGFGSRQVFHSIRKTVITQLLRADVREIMIAELVGHETGTVTFDIYSQGASAAQKFAAISKIPTLPIQ